MYSFCTNILTFSSFRSLKEAFLKGLGYCDLKLINYLLVITTVIAENLHSLLIVSTGCIIVCLKSTAVDIFDLKLGKMCQHNLLDAIFLFFRRACLQSSLLFSPHFQSVRPLFCSKSSFLHLNCFVAPFVITILFHLCFSKKLRPLGAQPQTQLQQRRLENEEIAVKSVGFHVKWLSCPAG